MVYTDKCLFPQNKKDINTVLLRLNVPLLLNVPSNKRSPLFQIFQNKRPPLLNAPPPPQKKKKIGMLTFSSF